MLSSELPCWILNIYGWMVRSCRFVLMCCCYEADRTLACVPNTQTHTTASAQLLPSLPSVGIRQALLTRCQANFKITPISILCLFTTPSTHTHVLIPHSLSLSLKHHCFAVRGEKWSEAHKTVAKTSSLSRMHIHIWFSSPTVSSSN